MGCYFKIFRLLYLLTFKSSLIVFECLKYEILRYLSRHSTKHRCVQAFYFNLGIFLSGKQVNLGFVYFTFETHDLITHKSTPCLGCESDSSLNKPQQSTLMHTKMT